MIHCKSAIARVGYYVQQLDTTVYSIEELAYLVAHKGYALDSDFVCKKLVQWVETECQCEDLAYRLQMVLRDRGDKSAFVEAILRFAGCTSESEIERILQDISDGLNLSGYERRKAEADTLFGQKRYVQAILAYEALINMLPIGEQELLAVCYYNLASAKAQLFLYEEAMDAFEASYQMIASEETLFAWLKAARMYYPENQYLEMIGGREDLYELSLMLEEHIKDIESTWVTNENGKELEKLREWMEYGGKDGYHVASGRVLRELCEEYREYYN